MRFKRGILETVLLAWLWTWGTCCMWRELWLPQRLSPHSSPGRSHNVDLSSLPFFQVVLPLIDQYFKNHRLYFLSAASRPLCSGGHAANKEKEMVTSLFCKLGVLVRHRISLFGKETLEKILAWPSLGFLCHFCTVFCAAVLHECMFAWLHAWLS